MDLEDAYRFNTRVRALPTLADCSAYFSNEILAHGLTTFACGEMDFRDRDRNVFYIIEWSESWTRFYTKSGFINDDPIVDALGYRNGPFTWSDLRTDRKLAKAGRQALTLAAAEGWTEGLVVPMRRGGSRIGLVSMAGHNRITEPSAIAYLSLISICLHDHVRTLVASQGFAIAPVGLTDREIACLRLVARGFADKAIGAELGIAASTAHEFVEKAKARLKVKSRPELIAVAVSLGIIDM